MKTLHWHALVGYYFFLFAASPLAAIASDCDGYLGYLNKTAVPNIRGENGTGLGLGGEKPRFAIVSIALYYR